MITQTRWQQVSDWEPWNPAQRAIVQYSGLPGGYQTYYFNKKPNITQLLGADDEKFGAKHLIAFFAIAIAGGAATGYVTAKLLGH